MIIKGYSEVELSKLEYESVDLIFTSPPYYNAKKYATYITYDEFLQKMQQVIRACYRVLKEGRFFAINVSPVLIARETRSKSSKRLAIPFDMHRIFIEEGYDFIEDIVWEKPEGVGWSFGRGRRFSADRNPLQYKPLSITEYILVYRKHTDKLIDWNLKQYDKETLEASKIPDDYEKTNVWRIQPANSPKHPAVFPLVLAENIIRYYSFVGDVVLDPFAGIGTVGIAAQRLDRKFILIEKESKYCKHIFNSLNCLDFD